MGASGLVHWDEVETRNVEAGPLSGTWTNLGAAGGSVTTGLRRIVLEASRRSTPVHVHDAEEEIFYILSGAGAGWQDGATYPISAGDCIVHTAGSAAHTLIAGAAGLDVLAFGTRHASSACRLPRAGVAWLGPAWVEVNKEPHPWARDLAAGELVCTEPVARPGNVVAAAEAEEAADDVGDTRRRRRQLGAAGGSRLTGLNLVTVGAGGLSCPPHMHSSEEEIFVVLDGEGSLLLYYGDGDAGSPEEHPLRSGSVVVRPAGTGTAHAIRAGARPVTLLAYGERRTEDIAYYPRSRKLSFRGLGVIGRIEPCGYWDDEPPRA